MGSVNNAVRCGFICRLCSKIDKRVVHIYGELGRKYNLVQKIRDYLPIKVSAQHRQLIISHLTRSPVVHTYHPIHSTSLYCLFNINFFCFRNVGRARPEASGKIRNSGCRFLCFVCLIEFRYYVSKRAYDEICVLV